MPPKKDSGSNKSPSSKLRAKAEEGGKGSKVAPASPKAAAKPKEGGASKSKSGGSLKTNDKKPGDKKGSGSPDKKGPSKGPSKGPKAPTATPKQGAVDKSKSRTAWDDNKKTAGKAGNKGGKKEKIKPMVMKKKKGFFQILFKKTCGNIFNTEVIHVEAPEAREAVEALALTNKDLQKLKSRFDEIDLDGSGSIDSDEFFEELGENRSPFTDALFRLIDADGSGTIEFEEFIRVLTTYCMYTKDDILKFCFDCFDVDGSGTIDEEEFFELCKTVNNAAPMFPGNFASALTMFDVNDDGLIDFGEFIDIDRRFPMVLFPAFRLQDNMQKLTLGEARWRQINTKVEKQRQADEYAEQHGGRAPPESTVDFVIRNYMPCLGDGGGKIHVDKIQAARPAHVYRKAEGLLQ